MAEGRNFNTPNLSLRILAKKDGGISAFSFVVPIKAAKTAVLRHFLKRRARHVIKKHLAEVREGYYCAFFFRAGLAKLPFLAFESEILDGLAKANLLR